MAPEEPNVMDDCKQKLIAGYELQHLDLNSWSVEDVSQMILEVMCSRVKLPADTKHNSSA